MLRGQGAALYGPRACDKNTMTAIDAFYREELDHGRAVRLWLYAVAAYAGFGRRAAARALASGDRYDRADLAVIHAAHAIPPKVSARSHLSS